MKISYGITTWIEHEELRNLLNYLNERIDEEDEIVVVYDQNRVTPEVMNVMESFKRENYHFHPFNFQQNFLENKNYLGSKCKNPIIIQIDSDEIPSEILLQNVKAILESNPEIDVYWVPRINIVDGLGLKHVQQWGWNISKLDSQIGEKEFDLNNPQDLDEYNLLKKYNLIIEENKV